MSAAHVPQLRIFDGSDLTTSRERMRGWRLRQVFNEVTLPTLVRLRRAEGTIGKYRKAIWYWELVSDNPPVCQITAEMLDAFPAELLDPQRGLAITTNKAANQQQMYVEAILRTIGPRIGRRGGNGVLESVPYGQRLPDDSRPRRRFIRDLETWNLLYAHSRIATWPPESQTGLPAPLLWRAAWVSLFTFAPRRCELFLMPVQCEWERGVLLPAVRQQSEHPDGEVDVTSPHGWVLYHTPKTRMHKGGWPLVIPLSAAARVHLDAVCRLTRETVLCMGRSQSSATTWRKHSHRIQAAAGIDPPYGFHDLRRSVNRMYRRHTGSREVAKFLLGHQPRGVNAEAYDDLTEDAVEAVNSVPQPETFIEGARELRSALAS